MSHSMGGRAFSFYGDDAEHADDHAGHEMGGRAFSFYKKADEDSSSDSEIDESSDSDSEDMMGGARRRRRGSRKSRKSRASRSKSAGRKKLSRGLQLFQRIRKAIQKKKNCSYIEARAIAKKKFQQIARARSIGTPYKAAMAASMRGLSACKKRRGSRRASRRGSRRR